MRSQQWTKEEDTEEDAEVNAEDGAEDDTEEDTEGNQKQDTEEDTKADAEDGAEEDTEGETEENTEEDAKDGTEEDTEINLIRLSVAALIMFLYIFWCRDVTVIAVVAIALLITILCLNSHVLPFMCSCIMLHQVFHCSLNVIFFVYAKRQSSCQ